MKISIITALACGVLLAGCSSVNDTKTVTVVSGKTSPVGVFAAIDPRNCAYGGSPTPIVTVEPKHGKVSFSTVPGVLPNGPNTNVVAHCKGEKVMAIGNLYTPAVGFKGTDEYIVQYNIIGGGRSSSMTVKYVVTVR